MENLARITRRKFEASHWLKRAPLSGKVELGKNWEWRHDGIRTNWYKSLLQCKTALYTVRATCATCTFESRVESFFSSTRNKQLALGTPPSRDQLLDAFYSDVYEAVSLVRLCGLPLRHLSHSIVCLFLLFLRSGCVSSTWRLSTFRAVSRTQGGLLWFESGQQHLSSHQGRVLLPQGPCFHQRRRPRHLQNMWVFCLNRCGIWI